MPKNTIKGKNNRPGSNKATGRDYTYDKKYQSSEKMKRYRAELNRINREKGTYGNKDGKDVSHTKVKGKYVLESYRKNRARNGHNGKSTKKSV